MTRGEVWLAALDPVRGSEQAGTRPVLILQVDAPSDFLRTVVIVPCEVSSATMGKVAQAIQVSLGF